MYGKRVPYVGDGITDGGCKRSLANTLTKAEMDAARTKTWWFFGDTTITHEGILTDLKEFKKKGIGGVVYYDQIHGKGTAAPSPFTPQWWSDLKFAAQAAKNEGLTFEINISNGYVAGGPWITPELSMQMIKRPEVNTKKIDRMVTVRSITYNLKPAAMGKATTSAMNVPGIPSDEFYGTNYIHLDAPCVLEASNDSVNRREVLQLRPTRKGMTTFTNNITMSFPATTARYFRLHFPSTSVFSPSDIRSVVLFERQQIDNWEEKAAYRSEYIINSCPWKISSPKFSDKYLAVTNIAYEEATSELFSGKIESVSTNAKLKHGRPGMGGLQCDNMSRLAVETQWNNYVRPICDTLSAIGCKPMGVVIDSHEAGPQNWTPGLDTRFKQLCGYDMTPFIPCLYGYVVESKERSDRFLYDYRRTCAHLINTEFFGAIDSLARHDGLTLTAQAIGNGLSIVGDNLQAKCVVQKPQGEFWAYQVDGNYDVKESSSAAHLYGKPIASAEAFTDANYQKTPEDLKKIADLAYVFGINEFVICAIPNQPWIEPHPGYITGGREYGINRSNSWWNDSKPFWDYQARTAALLRRGKPVVDIALFLGGDAPVKILANRVPKIPDGYDFDAFTSDALMQMKAEDHRALMPSGMSYSIILLQNDCHLSVADSIKLRSLEAAGVPIFGGPFSKGMTLEEKLKEADITPDCAFHSESIAHEKVYDDRLYFCHRTTDRNEIYFIVNHSSKPYNGNTSFRAQGACTSVFNPYTNKEKSIRRHGTELSLSLDPYESVFVIF
jgi:hypothetical protein